MARYEVIDNKGGVHYIQADSDRHVLEIMRTRFVEYIYSILSSDCITIYRPNGYLLAYINTATGEQTVKSMEDWGLTPDTDTENITL